MTNLWRIGCVTAALGLTLFASACTTSDSTTPTSSESSSSSMPSSPSMPASTPAVAPVAPATPNAPQNATPQNTAPAAPAAPGRDDDPGGSPCTDQNGAPGRYIYSDSSQQWVCEITGDAPQVNTPETPAPNAPRSDGDPGGTPCENQDGAKGVYIWSDSTSQWVCQIS